LSSPINSDLSNILLALFFEGIVAFVAAEELPVNEGISLVAGDGNGHWRSILLS
jgi:hypothetical protein